MDGVKKETDADMANEGTAALNALVSISNVASVHPDCSSIPGRTTGPTRRSTKGGWTEMEDEALARVVKLHNAKNWKKIAEFFPGRSDVQCLHRWQKVLNPDLIKGPWTKEEDNHIIELVEKHGCKKWSVIARSLPGRIGKQCRERWHNHLNPAVKKDAWTKEEELILIHAHRRYGNKWAEIARLLPGRADNSIKNHWNCSVKKKLDSCSASGFHSLQCGIGALDVCNHVNEEKNGGDEVEKQNNNSIIYLDQNPGLNFGAEICSLGLILGNAAKREQHSDDETVRKKILNSLKQEVNDIANSPIATPCDDRYATLLLHDPMRVMERDDANASKYQHAASTFRSKAASPLLGDRKFLQAQICDLEPADTTDTNLSLRPPGHVAFPSSSSSSELEDHAPSGATICPEDKRKYSETVPYISPNEMRGSQKTLQEYATARNGMIDKDLDCEGNSPSSLLECEFENDLETGVSNKTPGTPLHTRNVNIGALCYQPPQLTSLDDPFGNGRFGNEDTYVQQIQSPVLYSTPQSYLRSVSGSGKSPESILRTAAKSFKNTPSILRKRVRETLRLFPEETRQTASSTGNVSDDICTPEARDHSYDSISGSVCSFLHESSEDRTFTEVLNVKRLFPSPPHSQRTKTATTGTKSLEKRLEYAFDLEWDSSNPKHSTSTTATGLPNALPGARTTFMPLDNLDNSGVTSKRQNFMLLGASFNCNT